MVGADQEAEERERKGKDVWERCGGGRERERIAIDRGEKDDMRGIICEIPGCPNA